MVENNESSKAILKESVFIIGTVSSVEGRIVKVKVKKDKNLSHLSYKGKTIKNVSVGSYVKIVKGFIEIIGKVEGEFITEERYFSKEYTKEESKIARFLSISLFGHFDKDLFKQGIKEMPLIDNECFLLDRQEFNRLHQFFQTSERTIELGTLSEEPSQTIRVSIRKLLASHIGIFGNTGSGKSNTLARIFTEVFRVNQNNPSFRRNARFVLFDFNGEYTKDKMITKDKLIFNLTTQNADGDRYRIKQSYVESLEVMSVLLEATEKTQKPFLNRAMRYDYLKTEFTRKSGEAVQKLVREILQKGDQNLGVNFLSELFNHLSKIDLSQSRTALEILERLNAGELKYHSERKTYYIGEGTGRFFADSRLDQVMQAIFGNLNDMLLDSSTWGRIKFKILSQYFHEIIHGFSNQEHIRPLIGRMFKKFEMLERLIVVDDTQDRNRTLDVINLKNVNLEMKKTLPLIISKQLYDDHKQRGNYENESLHIIVDEAHNILSLESQRESESWKDYRLETFEELIKEGRKFSTFLTISSQRPHDISPTIISQLHNYFIHRLINDNDIRAVEKAIAYLDKLSFESIPILSVGSCFVAGLATDIPIKVDIRLLPREQQPTSETINFDNAWPNKI